MRLCSSYGTRRITAVFLLSAAMAFPSAAQDYSPFTDPDERQEQLEPPPSLPEGLRGTVRPKSGDAPVRHINTIREVFQVLGTCWRLPPGSGFSGQEITVRLSFKRNGEVLGQPRITYYKPGTQAEQREPFARSVREAFERCTPLPFTESFGAAIAGRIFAIRFVDSRPM